MISSIFRRLFLDKKVVSALAFATLNVLGQDSTDSIVLNDTILIHTTLDPTTPPPTTTQGCADEACVGANCDAWADILPYDCFELEEDYGCDCTGCLCPTTEFEKSTTNVVITTVDIPSTSANIRNATTMVPAAMNICSDGTVSNICLMDMAITEYVALFGLPIFWAIVFILVGCSKSIAKCRKEEETKKKRMKSRKTRRKVLKYNFSNVAKITFLTHTRSWTAFKQRTYAEMEEIDFQGVPLSGFRSKIMYGSDLYTKWSGTALTITWRSAVQASCFAGMMLWVLYFLKQLQDWNILDGSGADDSISSTTDYNQSISNSSNTTTWRSISNSSNTTTWSSFDNSTFINNTSYTTLHFVRAHIAAVAGMNSVIEEYVSFMLIFYTILNVNNYLRCFSTAIHLQQQVENMALHFVTIYPSFRKTKRSKYQLYRYLNVLHFFAYAYLIPDFFEERNQFPMYLSNVGLLTKKEAKKMEELNTPIETVRLWLVQVLQNKDLQMNTSIMTGKDSEQIRRFLVDRITAIVHAMHQLKSATDLYPPLSFVQIMRLLVDVYLLIMPVVLVNQMYIAADPPLAVQLTPVLACFILTLLYNGLMNLVAIIRMPFGDRIDQFHVAGALIIMDQKIFKILTRDAGKHLYGRELQRIASKYDDRHLTKGMNKLPLTFVEEEMPLWEEMFDSHHNAYYYHNNKTKESSWVSPKDVHATHIMRTPANKATKDFMALYTATVKIQAILRRKLAIRNVAVMLMEREMGGGEDGE